MSTCLNYQLLLRRIENYSKTVAWHIKRRDPEHCYVGLLQLSLRCFNTMDANARSQNCTPSVNRCHNLVDICLGPIDSSSSMALFHFGKLLKITKQLQAIYDPVLQLRIVNESIDAITIEKTQNVLEDCAILKDGVDMSTNRLEQTERDIRSYVSTLIKRPIDASLVKSKLEDVVNTLRSHLDKVREYLERIEEVAKFVESHVCIPYKKQKRIAPDIKESAGEHLSKEGQAWDEDSSSECEVEALRDISSAYRAAQHSNRKFFNFLLHGSGYEPDLPEGPLLAVELKSAPRIRQTPSPAASPNQRMHFNESEETGQTKLSSQLPEWSTKSTSGLKRLRSFTLLSLGLTFAM
ncbi:conserved hypothetical protein [Echinococcus multilocularis]|uniref:Uncharacterized protein n=1 Tax=Echinococcus multilocularis TaxID=6211 RepID=A0A068Y4G3_ECHMU|nr:conserved hypothetical protein [Echinococcus multilocularis]